MFRLVTFWLAIETRFRTSSPIAFICAFLDATAAAMWLWSSKPNWFWGDSWVEDAGGVFWVDCLGSSWLSGAETGCMAFFGDSDLGRLGGHSRVAGSRGEAVKVSWAPRASPILTSDIGLVVAVNVLVS